MLKIVFYKSSSKYYDSVCLQCECLGEYKQEKSKNVWILSQEELKSHIRDIRKVFELLRHWTKNEYYIDQDVARISDVENLLDVIDCGARAIDSELLGEYCYGECGWGCKHLAAISLRRDSYRSDVASKKWYSYGMFRDGIWVIDKDRIMQRINDELESKHLRVCPHFNLERIQESLESLPVCIDVERDEEWQYTYREAPIGLTQTEIIGVEPKNIYDDGIHLSLFRRHFEKDEEDKIERNIPDTTFNDIGGIDGVVRQVREVIELPLIAPQLFEHYQIKPHKGILLYGPPGCGKTLIAKAIANEIKAHFISVNGPEILNRFLGQSEENLRKVFEEAQRNAPSIIYFDEFDSISPTRDSDANPHMSTIVNQLLTLMDGIKPNHHICAIASTNRIDMIDPAIKRPGRFDYVIEITKPSSEGCKKIFQIHTDKMPIEKDFDRNLFVEKYLTGCSGAEIAFVVAEAAYNSIRRTVPFKDWIENASDIAISPNNVIIEQDFIKAAKSLKDSLKQADTAKWRYQ